MCFDVGFHFFFVFCANVNIKKWAFVCLDLELSASWWTDTHSSVLTLTHQYLWKPIFIDPRWLRFRLAPNVSFPAALKSLDFLKSFPGFISADMFFKALIVLLGNNCQKISWKQKWLITPQTGQRWSWPFTVTPSPPLIRRPRRDSRQQPADGKTHV